jgi:hypothetical protein
MWPSLRMISPVPVVTDDPFEAEIVTTDGSALLATDVASQTLTREGSLVASLELVELHETATAARTTAAATTEVGRSGRPLRLHGRAVSTRSVLLSICRV